MPLPLSTRFISRYKKMVWKRRDIRELGVKAESKVCYMNLGWLTTMMSAGASFIDIGLYGPRTGRRGHFNPCERCNWRQTIPSILWDEQKAECRFVHGRSLAGCFLDLALRGDA